MTEPALTQLSEDVYELDGARAFAVASRSNPDLIRLVVLHDATWRCTCPATVVDCWHVKEVRKLLEGKR